MMQEDYLDNKEFCEYVKERYDFKDIGQWKAVYYDNTDCECSEAKAFKVLEGKTIVSIEGLEKSSECAVFVCDDGEKYRLIYNHDCCAQCDIEDVVGDAQDIIGSPILLAEMVSSEENTDEESWVFYKLSTIKGSVDIRWYGASSGWYSQEATFEKFSHVYTAQEQFEKHVYDLKRDIQSDIHDGYKYSHGVSNFEKALFLREIKKVWKEISAKDMMGIHINKVSSGKDEEGNEYKILGSHNGSIYRVTNIKDLETKYEIAQYTIIKGVNHKQVDESSVFYKKYKKIYDTEYRTFSEAAQASFRAKMHMPG